MTDPVAAAPVVVLALVRDLLFASKITSAARAAGVEAQIIRDPAQLAGRQGSLLLVDLNLAGAIEPAAQWKTAQGKDVIGFVSHVDTATIAQARDAGIGRLMARGAFADALPPIMQAVKEADGCP